MDERDLLRNTAVFGALREDTVDFLLGLAEEVVVEPGDYFFRQGEIGDCVFVLRKGNAILLKESEEHALYVRTFGPGDGFGEIALLAMVPRTASVRATERCEALCIRNSHLMKLWERDLEQFTLLVMNLGREVCRLLTNMEELVFRLAPEAASAIRKARSAAPPAPALKPARRRAASKSGE